jgi:hypothetical protein
MARLVKQNLLLVLLTGNALANPLVLGISGDPVDGNEILVSGLEFGSNANPEPYIWDDFDSGANGQLVAGNAKKVGDVWEDEYTNELQRPVYTDQNQRLNSDLSSRHVYRNSIGWHSSLAFINENLPRAFMSFWWRYENTGAEWSRNVKPWMVYGNLDGNNRPTAYAGLADTEGVLRSNILDVTDTGTSTLWGETTLPEVNGRWVRFDIWLELSDPGVPNGTYKLWTHKPYAANPEIMLELNSGDNEYVTRSSNGHWRSWRIGAYHAVDDPASASAVVQVDDVYVSSTRARVEIGNAARWQDVTHREVQIAKSWSDGSISFEVNQGGFESIAGTYLYVIDAQGEVNNIGLPLCDDCPNPPTGLSARAP